VRTILFNTENVTVNTKETMYFLLSLVVFALVAAGYVLQKGLEHQQGLYKLVLSCVQIITFVVPPELPVELSLAVNTSLMALIARSVFALLI